MPVDDAENCEPAGLYLTHAAVARTAIPNFLEMARDDSSRGFLVEVLGLLIERMQAGQSPAQIVAPLDKIFTRAIAEDFGGNYTRFAKVFRPILTDWKTHFATSGYAYGVLGDELFMVKLRIVTPQGGGGDKKPYSFTLAVEGLFRDFTGVGYSKRVRSGVRKAVLDANILYTECVFSWCPTISQMLDDFTRAIVKEDIPHLVKTHEQMLDVRFTLEHQVLLYMLHAADPVFTSLLSLFAFGLETTPGLLLVPPHEVSMVLSSATELEAYGDTTAADMRRMVALSPSLSLTEKMLLVRTLHLLAPEQSQTILAELKLEEAAARYISPFLLAGALGI